MNLKNIFRDLFIKKIITRFNNIIYAIFKIFENFRKNINEIQQNYIAFFIDNINSGKMLDDLR